MTAQSEDRSLTTIEVTRYFKGKGPRVVTVTGFGWGTDCLPVINVQDHGIFYTGGDPDEQLLLISNSGFASASNELVVTIIEVVGQQPAPPTGGPFGIAPLLFILAALAMLGIVATVVIILWLKRKQA